MKTRNIMGLFSPRRRERGGAMVEFILMIPLMIFIVVLGTYLALGMRTKQLVLVDARFDLWRNINNWWRYWDDSSHGWPEWDANAIGEIGGGADSSNRPRGTGEALDYLYENAGAYARDVTTNSQADEYFRRIWNNLPGRHEVRRGQMLQSAEMTSFLDGEVKARHVMDSSAWPIAHLRLWILAQHGPMKEINEIFHEELQDVPPEFMRMREEVFHNWFEESWLPNWNHQQAVIPTE